jgi:single-strand selective monofunctional uracil DNA glycosylase
MAQTGVPFGDVVAVRDWIGISAPVGRPPVEHPKRPVLGFNLKRREGSGKRLWGWAESKFESADSFFDEIFVHNYCPLLFLHETGRNIVPEKLSKAERARLFAPCDHALVKIVAAIAPEVVIGVGKFASSRASEVLAGTGVCVDRILHPSPANPLANKDWAGQVEPVFRTYGVKV